MIETRPRANLFKTRAALLALCGGCALRPPEPAPTPSLVSGAVVLASAGVEADLQRTRAFGATRPIYERPLDASVTRVEGLGSGSAETCGACHEEIYEEWQVSTHAAAWIDPQFQAEITKSANRWLCLNCHTPLLVQQDRWPVGLRADDVELPELVENALFDAALREEGITCAACHVVDGVIHGPGLEDGQAPHAVQADARFTSETLCLRCHQAEATYAGKTFACSFQTGEEWAQGPYAAEGTGCTDCHMPRVTRPAATGGPPREVARHWWRGAGIPKVAGVHPPEEANPAGLGLEASWEGDRVVVSATNARAGHRLPTGDPERWVQITLRFADATGAALGEPWTARIGQEWSWHPVAQKLGDNRLAPRETRAWTLDAPAGAVEATITGSSHRMSEETARWHGLADYPTSRVTHTITLRPDAP